MLPRPALRLDAALLPLIWMFTAIALAAAPKLTVTQPTIDFGVAQCGDVVAGKFEIRNEGDSPLELTVNAPSDVTLKHADRTIAPQSQGTIAIEANTSRLSLELARFKLTVTSNDPAAKATTLELRGKLTFAVVPNPNYIRIVGVRGEIGSLLITLTATDAAPFRVIDAATADAPIQVEVGRTAAAATQQLKVHLPADAKIGQIAGWLDVRTDHPKRSNIRLPVSGFIRPPVLATPPVLELGDVPPGEILRRTFLVKTYSANAVNFSPPECDSPAIALSREDDERRKEMNIRLTFTPGEHRGPFTATIRVRTTHPDVPVLEVPVRANVR